MGSVGNTFGGAVREEDTQVLRCLLCHRARLIYRECQGTTEWETMTEFLSHYWLRFPDFIGIDTYCDECTVYYHQLMTYGQSAQGHEHEASLITNPSSRQKTIPMGVGDLCQPSEVQLLPSSTMG